MSGRPAQDRRSRVLAQHHDLRVERVDGVLRDLDLAVQAVDLRDVAPDYVVLGLQRLVGVSDFAHQEFGVGPERVALQARGLEPNLQGAVLVAHGVHCIRVGIKRMVSQIAGLLAVETGQCPDALQFCL